MILNIAECIICSDFIELQHVANLLTEHGFLMIEGFGEIVNCISKDMKSYGVRWVVGQDYPQCIAKMTPDHVSDVITNGELFDAYGRNPHNWISYQDFLLRLFGKVEVDDLL